MIVGRSERMLMSFYIKQYIYALLFVTWEKERAEIFHYILRPHLFQVEKRLDI